MISSMLIFSRSSQAAGTSLSYNTSLPFHSTKHHPDSKRASLPYLPFLSGTSPSLVPFKAKLSKAETMPTASCLSAPLFSLLQACYWNFSTTSQRPSCYQYRSLRSQSLNNIQSPELSSSLWLAVGKPCFSFLLPLLWAYIWLGLHLGPLFHLSWLISAISRTSNIISKTSISCSTSLLDAGAGCMSDDENVKYSTAELYHVAKATMHAAPLQVHLVFGEYLMK